MERELTTHLLTLMQAFASALDITPSAAAHRAAGDGRFYERLREPGLGYNIRTYDRAVQWFSDHWPENAQWPVNVPRPQQTTASKPVRKRALRRHSLQVVE